MKKLSKQQVLDIYNAVGTLQEIGHVYGISPARVGCIKRGVSHRAVTGITSTVSTRIVLSEELIYKIAEYSGTTHTAAKVFGVSETTIKKYRLCHTSISVRNAAGQFVRVS